MFSNFKKTVIFMLTAFLVLVTPTLFGGSKLDPKIAKLRSAKKSKVIRVSPTGADGTLTPNDLYNKLKRNVTVFFEPGEYKSKITLKTDNIIVEGKPGGDYKLDLEVEGKKIIIKNLTATKLRLKSDIQVVDSFITEFSPVVYQKRTKILIANSAFKEININGGKNEAKFVMVNCTVRNKGYAMKTNRKAIAFYGKVALDLYNCVLFSETIMFYSPFGTEDMFLKANNSMLFSEDIWAQKKVTNGFLETKDPKDLKKVFKKVALTKCTTDQNPVFLKEKITKAGGVAQNYQLKDNADKMGANFSKEWGE